MAYLQFEDFPALKGIEVKINGSPADIAMLLYRVMMADPVFFSAAEMALEEARKGLAEGKRQEVIKLPPTPHPSQN